MKSPFDFNRKQVWIVSWYDFPFYEGTTARIKGLASTLGENGIQATVLSPLFHRRRPPKSGEVPCNVQYVDLRLLGRFAVFSHNRTGKFLSTAIFWLAVFLWLLAISRVRPILVQFEHTFSAPPAVLLKPFGVKIVADDIHLSHRRMKSWMFSFVRIFELWACKQSDAIVTSFRGDYSHLKSLFADKAYFVSNGINIPCPVERSAERKSTLLFVGSMTVTENQRAVEDLLDIAQQLYERRRDFEVYIVGGPLSVIDQLTKHDTVSKGIVKFLGFVSDFTLKDMFRKSQLGLLPYFGETTHTSQRIKALEYFAYGLTVISSPQGVGGIVEIKDGVHVLLASSKAEMVRILDRCLSQKRWADQIAMAGRELIANRYSWSTISKGYIQLLLRLTNGSSDNIRAG